MGQVSKRSLVVLSLLVCVALLVGFASPDGVTLNDIGVAAAAWVAGCLTLCLVVRSRPRPEREQRLERVNLALEESNANLDRAFGQLQKMKDKRMDA